MVVIRGETMPPEAMDGVFVNCQRCLRRSRGGCFLVDAVWLYKVDHVLLCENFKIVPRASNFFGLSNKEIDRFQRTLENTIRVEDREVEK